MRRPAVLLFAAVLCAAGLLLRSFPPERYSFYPRCPVYTWLHVLCPGCGGTRAFAALLHGDLLGALTQNALLIALLPLLGSYCALCCGRAWRTEPFRWPQPPKWMIPGLLAVTALFTVGRNLVR